MILQHGYRMDVKGFSGYNMIQLMMLDDRQVLKRHEQNKSRKDKNICVPYSGRSSTPTTLWFKSAYQCSNKNVKASFKFDPQN